MEIALWCGYRLLCLYVAIRGYLRRAWYTVWPAQVWVSWCSPRGGKMDVTLLCSLFRFWTGEKIWKTEGTWHVRYRTLHQSREVAYRGPLSRAWEIQRGTETTQLHRHQVNLHHRGQTVDHDLGLLDSWYRLQDTYDVQTVSRLDRVFEILGWEVDELTWTLWNPYQTISRCPSQLQLGDLYHDGSAGLLVSD